MFATTYFTDLDFKIALLIIFEEPFSLFCFTKYNQRNFQLIKHTVSSNIAI